MEGVCIGKHRIPEMTSAKSPCPHHGYRTLFLPTCFFPLSVLLLSLTLLQFPYPALSIMTFPEEGVYSIFPHEELSTGKRKFKFEEYAQNPSSLVGVSSASLLAPPTSSGLDRGRGDLDELIVPILRPTSSNLPIDDPTDRVNKVRKLTNLFSASEPDPSTKLPFHPYDPPNIFRDDDVEVHRSLLDDNVQAPIRYYEHRRPRIFFEDEERRLFGYGTKYYHDELLPKPDDPSSENNVIRPSPLDFNRDINLHRFYLRNPPPSYLPEAKLPPHAILAKNRRPLVDEADSRPPRIHLFTTQNIDKYGVAHRMHHIHPDGPVEMDTPGPGAFINHDEYLDFHTKIALATLSQEKRKLEDTRRKYLINLPRPMNNIQGLNPPPQSQFSQEVAIEEEEINEEENDADKISSHKKNTSPAAGSDSGTNPGITIMGVLRPDQTGDETTSSEDCVRLLKNCREKDDRRKLVTGKAGGGASGGDVGSPGIPTASGTSRNTNNNGNINPSQSPTLSPIFTPTITSQSLSSGQTGGVGIKHQTQSITKPSLSFPGQTSTKSPVFENGFVPSRPFPLQGLEASKGTIIPLTEGSGVAVQQETTPQLESSMTTGGNDDKKSLGEVNNSGASLHLNSSSTSLKRMGVGGATTLSLPASSFLTQSVTDKPPGDEIEYGTLTNFNLVSPSGETTGKVGFRATTKPGNVEYGHETLENMGTELPRLGAGGAIHTEADVVVEKTGSSPIIFVDSAELDGFYVNSSGSPPEMMIHVQRVRNMMSGRRKIESQKESSSSSNTTHIHHGYVQTNESGNHYNSNVKSKLKVESTMKFQKNGDEVRKDPGNGSDDKKKSVGSRSGINSGVVSKVHAHISECPKLYGSVEIICDINIKPRHGHPNPRITVGWIRKFYNESEPDKVVAVNKRLAYEEDFHDKFNVTLAPGISPMLRSVLTVREVMPQDCGNYQCDVFDGVSSHKSDTLLFLCH